MREIKFRGKRIDTGGWVFGGYHKHIVSTPCVIVPKGEKPKPAERCSLIIESGFSDWNMPKPLWGHEVNPATVGQYTGMVDRNKKEVYEGDIVTILQTDEETFIRKHEVKFLRGRWVYQKHCGGYEIVELGKLFSFLPTECYNRGLEVVGNIYDNPELLKE